MADWIAALLGFIGGGGLAGLMTIGFSRRKAKTETDVAEISGLCKIIEAQGKEIASLLVQKQKMADTNETVCSNCTYKQFYLKMERMRNESINAKCPV